MYGGPPGPERSRGEQGGGRHPTCITQTLRPVSDPSDSISNAVNRAAYVSPTIRVESSGVITLPLGKAILSATTRL
jgi:hypothetical protein